MARKSTDRGRAKPSTPVKVQGLLAKEGETVDSLALTMLVERLESMEKLQKMQADMLQNMMSAQAENMNSMQREFDRRMAAEKNQAEQGMQAIQEKLKQILEKRQPDPKTQKEMLAVELKKAKKKMARDKAKFLKSIENGKKGTLNNTTGKPDVLQVNGENYFIDVGINKDVPSVFIEQWESRKQLQRWALEQDLALRTNDNRELSANEVQIIRGQTPIWDENVGALP